jgi:hypothetical protein
MDAIKAIFSIDLIQIDPFHVRGQLPAQIKFFPNSPKPLLNKAFG